LIRAGSLKYPAVLNTRSNTSNKEIFPNVRKASPIR
jgi:hypothetical protein